MNMSNLIVENKDNGMIYEVFDVTYDDAGYPRFLIYRDNQWIRMSAKHFRPLELCYDAGGDIVRG